MFTRLADFDVLGYDPLLEYTYDNRLNPDPAKYNPIVLPSDDWRPVPIIPTPSGTKAGITSLTTIIQNGEGNWARELRVAGTNADGVTGYYNKTLADTEWQFVADTAVDLTGYPFLINDQTPILGPVKDVDYPNGPIINTLGFPVTLQLFAFQRFCTPATIQLSFPSDDGSSPSATTIDSTTTYDLLLHHLFMWPYSGTDEIGSLAVPLAMSESTDPRTKLVWTELLHGATNITIGVNQNISASNPTAPVTVSALFLPSIKWQFVA
jgi:hypothetical protein